LLGVRARNDPEKGRKGEEGGGGYHWCGGESTCADEGGEGQEGKRNYKKRVHCERCPREREKDDSGDTEEWRELRWWA